ncbi:MAG: DUF4035 domain-containing protein [Proteobacteria bacterium]|nr:MAG: DUF4035 domain-containing protein [Pseudomonadota bacterium]
MSHREFVSWCAFNKLSPVGDIRHDYYMAQIAAEFRRTIVKEPEKLKINDFMFFERMTKEKLKFKNLSPGAKEFIAPLLDKYN